MTIPSIFRVHQLYIFCTMRYSISIRYALFFIVSIFLWGEASLADITQASTENATPMNTPEVLPDNKMVLPQHAQVTVLSGKSESPPVVSVPAHSDDPLLDVFNRLRKQYGDIAVQANLRRIGEEPKLEASVHKKEEDSTDRQMIYLGIIFAGAVLLVLAGMLFGRRKTEPEATSNRKTSFSGIVPSGSKDNGSIDVPSKLPTSWFAGIDRKEIERLIDHAKTETVDLFFEKLGDRDTPSTADIQAANQAMGIALKERTESIDWIESLCGTETSLQHQEYLKAHLKELLVPPEIPDPTLVRMEVRTTVLCAVAAVGAVLGFLCGGWVARWLLGIPAESGLLFGAPIGAALGVVFVMLVANNETLRNRILLGLGVAGGIDVAFQIFKGFVPWPTGGKVSFVKRLLLYAVLALVVFVSRREKICDKKYYREEVESIVDNWLHTALAVVAVLTFKVKAIKENPFNPNLADTETLTGIVGIAKKLRRSSGENIPLVIDELVQELETHGFEIPEETEMPEYSVTVTPEQLLVWDDSMKERYKTMGIIRPGDTVKVEEEPIVRDGVVEKIGLVRKIRK